MNKGYVVRRVNAYVNGARPGYLKISYVPSERVDECYPTVWHWMDAIRGSSFRPDDLADTWLRAHHANYVPESLVGTGVSYLGLLSTMAPDEATMRADLEALADKPLRHLGGRSPNEDFAHFLRTSVDYAFVDFVRVSESHRRQGIATALYNEGARWMAERFDLPLHGSGLQSPEAEATWEAMVADGSYPIQRVTREDGKQVFQMDYRVRSRTARSSIHPAPGGSTMSTQR